MRRCSASVGLSLALACAAPRALGAPPDEPVDLEQEDAELYRKLTRPPGTYARILVATSFGGGFRFNNPYRLRSQLGDTPQSVSATAPYFDAALGASFGPADGIQHGGMLHLAAALEGVSQQAFSASYLVLYRGPWPVLGYGRAGTSLLTTPDPNVGGELAGGLAYFFTGALGLTAEVVGNLFWGADVCEFESAAGCEAEASVIPVLSLQGGIIMDYEVLP